MKEFDVAIIGGGGAGLTAGIYTSRGNLKTVIFEKMVAGGQISATDMVENYPGFPEGISGMDIAMKMEEQAQKYGADIVFQSVSSVCKDGDRFVLSTDGDTYSVKAVILASGANARKSGAKGEQEFSAKGVSYCATCDGAFFRGKEIVVIGGGDSAVQEALFLTKFASRVTIVHRRDQLRASKILQERAFASEKIDFAWNAVVEEIAGSATVEKIILKDTQTGELREFATQGVFVFIGHDPVTDYLQGFVVLDEHNYVVTADNYETSVKGVFACGEVRQGATRQLVSACGEGCTAALAAQEYLDSI